MGFGGISIALIPCGRTAQKAGQPPILANRALHLFLEAVVDYHMFFWHVSYGYTGNIGDLNVLNASPLMERMVDGTFHNLEEEAEVVPFEIGDEEFTKCFILVDGIYPKFSRFVKGIKEPTSLKEKKYTAWQEACRKDVERVFGVLKGTWQFLDRPILLHKLTEISLRTTCCIILHNMLVADRCMGDCRATYRPSCIIDPPPATVQQPADLQEIQGAANTVGATGIGMDTAPPHLRQQVTQLDRFKELDDKGEHLGYIWL
jgi:Plant transposon protein